MSSNCMLHVSSTFVFANHVWSHDVRRTVNTEWHGKTCKLDFVSKSKPLLGWLNVLYPFQVHNVLWIPNTIRSTCIYE